MTLAAEFAIAQECVLRILRMICQIIYELDNQATWANILACQGLSGSNLRESPNVYGYTTPTMVAARAKNRCALARATGPVFSHGSFCLVK